MHLEMMQRADTRIDIFILVPLLPLLLLQAVIVQGSPIHKRLQQNGTVGSPWHKRVTDPRPTGCWNRPWICNQGEYPPRVRRLCCRNRCVEVTSDVNNCGLCGFRCPFTWQCCRGLCINTNINPFHCGRCEHRCRFPSFCFYGMCGYAQPFPPRPPFPFPPKPPKPEPPFPFPPKPPKPEPPFPFPPKPPKPEPPFPLPPKPPKPEPPLGPYRTPGGGQPPPLG